MKRFNLAVAACGVLFIGVIGCNSAKQEAQAPATQEQSAVSAAPASADGSLSGKVVETMNSGGYTYVCIEKNGQKTWVAAPEAKVKVGQEVTCAPGMEMKNFKSKTLNRTFASIIFSTGIH